MLDYLLFDSYELVAWDYWEEQDDAWRELVCTDDDITEREYHEYLDAWWDYEDVEYESEEYYV